MEKGTEFLLRDYLGINLLFLILLKQNDIVKEI